MSSAVKIMLVAISIGFLLTIVSLVVGRYSITVTNNMLCNGNTETTTSHTRGYPLGYLASPNTTNESQGQAIIGCGIEEGANSTTDYIVQHTPGHKLIFNLIQNYSIDLLAFTQDFFIMIFIGLYPASLLVDRRSKGRTS